MDHAGAPAYYAIRAVDVHGNAGPVTYLLPAAVAEVDGARAHALALHPVRPNPWRGPRMAVAFELPVACHVRLELLDVSGRRVIAVEEGVLDAGRHDLELGVRHALPTGLYLLRLTQARQSRVTRVVVAR